MNRFSSNTLGAFYMMLAMGGYVLNDMLMKLTSSDLNLFQAILVRGMFACALMGLLCWRLGGFRTPNGIGPVLRHPMTLLRTFGETGGTLCFITALFHLPIANVTAVLQVLPLTITLGAAFLFGEPVGWRRYLAIIAGFLGVLLIIRPGSEGFNIYAVYAVAAAGFVTLRDLATRRLPRAIPSLLISFITAIAVTLMGAVGSMFEPWRVVDANSLTTLAGAAMILTVGYIFSTLAVREGDMSFISPFRYSILIWALLIGYFVFGDLPDGLALIGAFIVVVSGLFTFYREQKLMMKDQSK